VHHDGLQVVQTDGCHQGVAVAASLTLDNTAISTAAGAKALIGKKNSADPNYPAACMAGMYNLIDSAAPDMSLLYTKLADPPICGMRMPQIGAALKATDKTCVLNWINSVIALP